MTALRRDGHGTFRFSARATLEFDRLNYEISLVDMLLPVVIRQMGSPRHHLSAESVVGNSDAQM
jgi:hypothetical protein